MLTELTDVQRAALKPHADKWIEKLLECRPSNRELAEDGIAEAYKLAKLEPPTTIEWCDSPAAGMKRLKELGLPDSQALLYHGGQYWGAWWAARPAYYEDHCGLDVWGGAKRAAMGLIECGWWWPCEGYALVSERHRRLHRDEQGRLHSTLDQAIGWADGIGLYVVHGITLDRVLGRSVLASSRARALAHGESVPDLHPRVAEVVAAAGPLTVEAVEGAANAEVRRVLMEAYGASEYLTAIGAELVDEDKDELDQPRRLYRANVKWLDEPLAFVVVRDSSVRGNARREYSLRVDPRCKTALEAVASCAGIKPEYYRLATQT